MHHLDERPDLEEDIWHRASVFSHADAAYVRTDVFLGRLGLPSGKLQWLVERTWTPFSEPAKAMSRRIRAEADSSFWISADGLRIAETSSTDSGGITLCARDATTGKQRWEKFIRAPAPSDWAEP